MLVVPVVGWVEGVLLVLLLGRGVVMGVGGVDGGEGAPLHQLVGGVLLLLVVGVEAVLVVVVDVVRGWVVVVGRGEGGGSCGGCCCRHGCVEGEGCYCVVGVVG